MKKSEYPVSASAPGSLMLLGEHAVLHGRRALVCAIDRRMTVSLMPLNAPVLKIDSALGTYEAPLDNLVDHPDFRFVLDAVKQYSLDPSFAKGYGGHGQGVKLKIDSEFSSDIGFGSSAAVTVATHAALAGNAENKMDLFRRSLATIHRVQGRSSGADVAASVFGGVVAYRADPLKISPICEKFPLTAVYSGSKMKTADVIRHLEERRALNPDYFERIFDRMDASVGEVIDNFLRLGEMLKLNQKLMEEMGLCNAALAEIIGMFRDLPVPPVLPVLSGAEGSGGEGGIPAKISGSGLGDCVVGLAEPTGFLSLGGQGKSEKLFGDYPVYALNVTLQGVLVGA